MKGLCTKHLLNAFFFFRFKNTHQLNQSNAGNTADSLVHIEKAAVGRFAVFSNSGNLQRVFKPRVDGEHGSGLRLKGIQD